MKITMKHAAGARIELSAAKETRVDGKIDHELTGKNTRDQLAILRSRKSASPAATARAKIAVDLKRRGLK